MAVAAIAPEETAIDLSGLPDEEQPAATPSPLPGRPEAGAVAQLDLSGLPDPGDVGPVPQVDLSGLPDDEGGLIPPWARKAAAEWNKAAAIVAKAGEEVAPIAPSLWLMGRAGRLLPEGSVTRQVAEGVTTGMEKVQESLLSPENVALMAAGLGLGEYPIVSRVVAGIFSAQMARQLPDLWRQFQNAPDLKTKVQIATEGLAHLGFLGGAAAHAIGGAGSAKIGGGEKYAGETGTEVEVGSAPQGPVGRPSEGVRVRDVAQDRVVAEQPAAVPEETQVEPPEPAQPVASEESVAVAAAAPGPAQPVATEESVAAAALMPEAGTELAMGGAPFTPVQPPELPPPPLPIEPSNTPEQVASVAERYMPGFASTAEGIREGLLKAFIPGALSSDHLRAVEDLSASLGTMNRQAAIAAKDLNQWERRFWRAGAGREDIPLDDNVGMKFASAVSTGGEVPPGFEPAARLLDNLYADRRQQLEDAGIPLESVRENYFGMLWSLESRRAFNAALQKAFEEGIIDRNADLNATTKEQRQWVRERAEKFLSARAGSDQDMLQYLARRPLAGKQSFRKAKVFDDVMTGIEFGLKPVSANPMRIAKLKLGEIDRALMVERFFERLRQNGRYRVISPYESTPEGWARVNDPYGVVYGRPTIKMQEWIDKAVYEGLLSVANRLGITAERLAAPGRGRLGYSVVGGKRVVTRFGTETSVLAHEIGHQIDERYNLWDVLGVPGLGRGQTPVEKQLRAIADITQRGQTARTREEKMAQVVEAYVHAPEKMKEVAPLVFERFDKFVRETPEIAPLAQIRPGLELVKLQAERYVGLPIMGYRIVPKPVADVINNYLSASLYNNPYVGPMWKAYMGIGSAVNQSQLGAGSGFHIGFTSADVQVSANAMVLDSVYRLLTGRAKLPELLQNLRNATTAMVRTPIIGDRVLNAWRQRDGPLNDRFAQVARAAELAGAKFGVDERITSRNIEKAYEEWFSGRKLAAVVRSPLAALEIMSKPILDMLVPRQKAGVFAEMVWQLIRDNPGRSLESLIPELRQKWNRVDARLGEVVWERYMMNNIAKNIVQGSVRAPGWTGGTIAELGGGFLDLYRFMRDWQRTGRLPDHLPDRVTYGLSLLISTMAVNGALTYAFTGQQPHGLDFFAFRDGGKDEQGRETRFLLPTYMKDILAYARGPLGTLANKTHPFISLLLDVLYKNKDYYGTEIRHPDDPYAKQAFQVTKYVVKQFEPFWVRGVRKQAQEEGGSFLGYALPYFGTMPAPRHITETEAERVATEIAAAERPTGGRTEAETAHSQARSQAIRNIAAGRTTASEEVRAGNLRRDEAALAARLARMTPLQRKVYGFNAEQMARVWGHASPDERDQLRRLFERKVRASASLSPERRLELLRMTRE